jgi:AcrR family transcriptional regulator
VPNPAGRPPSARTRQAILAATAELVLARGYQQVTTDAIVERAHASKRTIYRLWGSKARLVADAVRTRALPLPEARVPDSGDLEADLVAWLEQAMTVEADPTTMSIIRSLVAEQATVAGTDAPLTSAALDPTLAVLRQRFASARRRGETRPDADTDAAITLLVGAHTMGLLGAFPQDSQRVRAWVGVVIDGLRRV